MGKIISVIVPVYKVEDYLDDCVASLVAQTYPNLEIILVDDGSPDNCPAMCDAWAKKDSRIRVVHKENGGVSSARNVGLDLASGEFISFVDSDDKTAPEMYEKLLAALLKADADICACNVLLSENNTTHATALPVLVGCPEDIFSGFYKQDTFIFSPWNKLFRRELWNKQRYPVGITCGEDAYALFRAVASANRVIQISDALYIYRIRSGSAMTAAFRSSRMDEIQVWYENYEFIAKHYPNLRKAAYDFYLLKVNILIHEISVDQRKIFSAEYQKLYAILKTNICYILFSSQLPLKQRAKLLLDYCRL